VLKRLSDNGLVLNIEKCVWGQPQLEFLGQVSAASVTPFVARIAAVRDFPHRVNVQQLQAFLFIFFFYFFILSTATNKN
jgi:hypothetical protein